MTDYEKAQRGHRDAEAEWREAMQADPPDEAKVAKLREAVVKAGAAYLREKLIEREKATATRRKGEAG